MGVSILGGVGFTMAIFVANLAFTDLATVAVAKAAILAASIVAGIVGFLFLRQEALRADIEEERKIPGGAEKAQRVEQRDAKG